MRELMLTGMFWLTLTLIFAQSDRSISHSFPTPAEADTASAQTLLNAAEWQLMHRHQPDSASWWLDRLAVRLDTNDHTALLGRYRYARGQISFYRQQIQESLDHAEAAIRILETVGDPSDNFFAAAYRQRAEMKKFLHLDFGETVADYRKAIDLFEHQRDTVNYLETTQTLAQLYGKHHFYELARAEREIVFRYAEERSLYHLLAVAHLVQAIEYEIQGITGPVMGHLSRAKEAIAEVPELTYLAYYLNRFSLAHYYYAERADSVNYHFAEMERAMAELDNSERFQDNFERDRAMWHYVNQRYKEAEALSLGSLAKARARGEQIDILVNLELLKKIYAGLGRYEAAFNFAQRELMLEDSLYKQARLTQSVYYENLYEKEKEASRQAQEAEKLRLIELKNRERLRRYVLVGIIVVLLLVMAILYRGFLFQQEKEKLQQAFARDLLLGRTEERKHLAMDLHDHVIHDLSFIKNNLMEGVAVAEAAEIGPGFDKVLADLRGISLRLYDPSPELLGFNLALRELVQRLDESETLFFHLSLPDEEVRLPVDVAGQLFAILQEALRNVVEHARAKAVRTDVRLTRNVLEIEVLDNGIGFSTGNGKGIGLRSMRERAAIIGADFDIASREGGGTLIKISYKIDA